MPGESHLTDEQVRALTDDALQTAHLWTHRAYAQHSAKTAATITSTQVPFVSAFLPSSLEPGAVESAQPLGLEEIKRLHRLAARELGCRGLGHGLAKAKTKTETENSDDEFRGGCQWCGYGDRRYLKKYIQATCSFCGNVQ